MGEVQHILTAAPFTPVNMEPIFHRAAQLRETSNTKASKKELASKYIGCTAANIFYQESTRTRGSFELAQSRLGINYSSTPNARMFSSAAKGETLEHTIEVFNEYGVDLIVLRYDEQGGAEAAAAVSNVPIINAGDGGGEHPTQAFLDAYTIWEQFDGLESLDITFMGDLRYGRTIRSLAHVMSKASGTTMNFVSAPDLSLAEDIQKTLKNSGITYKEFTDPQVLQDLLPKTDVLYVTRTQTNLGAPTVNDGKFVVRTKDADLMKDRSIILHPMPIDRSDLTISEIHPEVDKHPRSRFLRQAGNGLYIRMAIMEAILDGKQVVAEAA